MAIASLPWWRCIARDRIITWYCWDTAVVPGLPSGAIYLLFSITSVLCPFLFLGFNLLLAEAFIGLGIVWLIVCISAYIVENGLQVFQVSKWHKDTVTEWVDVFVTLKLRRVNISGHRGKRFLTTVTFWAKPLKFRVHFPNSSGFCSRLACLGLPYAIYSAASLEINAKVKSIRELLAVRSRVESTADSPAALISSMQWFQWEWPLQQKVPWGVGPYGRRCLGKKREKTLKPKLEPDCNVKQCFPPLGHQFKTSLFGSDKKSFPHGPRKTHSENRSSCIQTDEIVWRWTVAQ